MDDLLNMIADEESGHRLPIADPNKSQHRHHPQQQEQQHQQQCSGATSQLDSVMKASNELNLIHTLKTQGVVPSNKHHDNI